MPVYKTKRFLVLYTHSLRKKVLALVLTLALALSVAAGAAFTDQKQIKNTEAVDMCVALNIISGYPDGSYKPEGNITRAEFTKMLCVLLNGGNTPATATKATPTFSDIRTSANASWAEGFIEYCYAKGIVSGVGGGKFNPNGNVTATEAAKMLLVALGYNADVENYTGAAWALKVNVQANQDGLYKGLEKIDTNAALTRDNAAQMVWNALQAYVIDKSSSIDRTDGSVTDIYTKSTTVDLLAKMYKGETEEAQMTGFIYNSTDKNWKYTVGDVTVKSSTDYTALMGQKVKAVYDDSTKGATKAAYGIFATDSEVLLTGVIGDLPAIASGDSSFKVDGTTYKLDNAPAKTTVYVFTDSLTKATADNLYALAGKNDQNMDIKTYDAQKFAAIDYDGNGKVDFLMVYPVAIAKVTSANSSTIKMVESYDPMGVMDKSVSFDTDDVTAYKDIKKNDYVIYTADKNTADNTGVLVKADLVTGKITKKSGSDLTIDSKVYTQDVSYTATLTVGTKLTDAVTMNGYVFSADTSASADPTEYAVVVSTVQEDFGTYRVKLLFSDGSKKVVDFDGNQTLKMGALCTFETNKDNEYTLTQKDGGATPSQGVSKKSGSSSKVAYIDGNAVLDDSVIFMKYNVKVENGKEVSASYKAITGATLKTMSTNQFNDDCVYFVSASSNSSTGVGTVNFAYIVTKAASISSSDKYYGYVTNVSTVRNSDNKNVTEITMWTDKGELVLNTKAGYNPSISDNTVIVYTLNSDNEIDKIITASDASYEIVSAAVTKITESFMGVNTTGTTTTNLFFDDDCIFVTIETDETAGVSKDCTYKDIGTADEITDKNGQVTGYTKNVIYIVDKSDNEVVFVAYDVDNALS